MNQKVGRNDPCPCGSGKKYKQCCFKLAHQKKKIKAVVIRSGPKPGAAPDLLERTFGDTISKLRSEEPPKPISTHNIEEKHE